MTNLTISKNNTWQATVIMAVSLGFIYHGKRHLFGQGSFYGNISD